MIKRFRIWSEASAEFRFTGICRQKDFCEACGARSHGLLDREVSCSAGSYGSVSALTSSPNVDQSTLTLPMGSILAEILSQSCCRSRAHGKYDVHFLGGSFTQKTDSRSKLSQLHPLWIQLKDKISTLRGESSKIDRNFCLENKIPIAIFALENI